MRSLRGRIVRSLGAARWPAAASPAPAAASPFCVAATASAIASSSASSLSSSSTSRSSIGLRSGDFRLDSPAFEIATHRRQPALETHLRSRFADSEQARDLGEGTAFDQLQADGPSLLVRELRDRVADRMRKLAAVLGRGEFVADILERHPLAVMDVAARLVGKAAARDRVQQAEHRAGASVHARERECRVGEHLLRQLLRLIGVLRPAAQVAVDLGSVLPEGVFGDALHLGSSRRGRKSNGCRGVPCRRSAGGWTLRFRFDLRWPTPVGRSGPQNRLNSNAERYRFYTRAVALASG